MKIETLTELYCKDLFSHKNDSFSLVEKDKSESVKVRIATFSLTGADFVVCSDEHFWNEGVDMYCKSHPIHCFKFRKKCDGFAICNYNNQKFLIWIELKSSFGEIFSTAIYQLSACYVKMKSYLECFENYTPSDYKEFAIVVCPPETNRSHEDYNNEVDSRKKYITGINTDTLTDKYRSNYRNSKESNIFTLYGTDFGSKKMHLKSNILFEKIPIYYFKADTESPNIDLLDVIHSIPNMT